MGIETEGTSKLIRFVCDGVVRIDGGLLTMKCRRNYEVVDEEFADAWREARALGWVNAEHRGVWTHYCPGCARDLGDD